ncbi:hypothetical protein OSB04_008388 [Centaurea solstitialis]|uniref:non-specific serine/threonine protein kinase n=1 Tax=Centaurea solstitialis TaxID=347529 RepID=A0AA38U674_9ASTR|nr:hypothetical protein OSB04_008388 [Centaurea solstitialis]
MVIDDDEDDDNQPENYIWQSFDHPGDTFLPGMKFGRNLKRGIVTNLTSWKSNDDPSRGSFMVYMNFNGLPQAYQNNGDGSHTSSIYKLEYISNEREIYTRFEILMDSLLTRLTVTPTGNAGRFTWVNGTQKWFEFSSLNVDSCEGYAMCEVYAACNTTQGTTPCGCLEGFAPKSRAEWEMLNWTSGCQREVALDCGSREGFQRYQFIMVPDTKRSWYDTNMTLEECDGKCRNECNCTAYATLDVKYGTGCLLWYGELIDMRAIPRDGTNLNTHLRLRWTRSRRIDAIHGRLFCNEDLSNGADSYSSSTKEDERASGNPKKMIIIIIPAILGLVILVGLLFLIIRKRKRKQKETNGPIVDKDVLDLPMFTLATLVVATNNFLINNKLGQGGFGPVYKGVLKDGREVAVKRLSVSSSQGVAEFKNEVIFISRLQHRNLVKILGYCFEGQEKMLIYEYMPNKGLDLFLFHETKSKTLGWLQRLHIVNGIARGMLYLHQDSRLRIIHRDLKAANILLDHDMNPKISDFGLARSFGGNETTTNTRRVVGTYGYMSPEYAGKGIFSVKSDVFSFGVLMLEIMSGIPNRHNLIGNAWRLYKEGKALELVDSSLIESDYTFKMLRSIQVGLLCVQNNQEDRPNMSIVVIMLTC